MRKPRVGDVTKWHWTTWATEGYGELTEVAVGKADNFYEFYKVLVSKNGKASKPNYFYGEMAWADVNRYVSDETGWVFFDLQEGGQYV